MTLSCQKGGCSLNTVKLNNYQGSALVQSVRDSQDTMMSLAPEKYHIKTVGKFMVPNQQFIKLYFYKFSTHKKKLKAEQSSQIQLLKFYEACQMCRFSGSQCLHIFQQLQAFCDLRSWNHLRGEKTKLRQVMLDLQVPWG